MIYLDINKESSIKKIINILGDYAGGTEVEVVEVCDAPRIPVAYFSVD